MLYPQENRNERKLQYVVCFTSWEKARLVTQKEEEKKKKKQKGRETKKAEDKKKETERRRRRGARAKRADGTSTRARAHTRTHTHTPYTLGSPVPLFILSSHAPVPSLQLRGSDERALRLN